MANYVGRAWGFVSVFLFIPIYLKFLGIEAYGLVGFYSILLGVLAFADMGFSATLNREMARLSAREDSAEDMRDLVRTYEMAYLCISSVLAVIVWSTSPLIAEHWLRSDVLEPAQITIVLRLMGIAIAFQLNAGLFSGGLMGLQQQVWANGLQIAWGAFRGIGSVLVLWLISPTILAFSAWQTISNGAYFLGVRSSLWHFLAFGSKRTAPRFKWRVFRETWRYAAGMAGMAGIFTLLTQTDKLAVSKLLPLEMLGYYTLAGTVASLPGMLAGPIVRAVFPRLTGLAENGDQQGLSKLYHRTSELVAVAIIPAGVTAIVFSRELILIWTGSADAADNAGLTASLLVAGSLMQSITAVPYYVALAHGDVRLNLKVGIASVAVLLPLLLFLIPEYGVAGAGSSWLIMNCIIVPPYMYFLHRQFLAGELTRWFFGAVGRPVLATLAIVLFGGSLIPHDASRLWLFLLIGLTWSLAVCVTAVMVPAIRRTLSNRLFGASDDAE